MKLTLKQRKARNGLLYILPWVIGMLCFFIPAIWLTISYSFSRVDQSNFSQTFVGFANFYRAFRQDAQFPQLLADILLTNLKNVPLILVFSYFVALLLKKPFKGSAVVKAIFFLTVILSSDMFINMQLDTSDVINAQTQGVLENASSFFSSIDGGMFTEYLASFGVGQDIIDFITSAVSSITDIFIRSGVQIFIFLAGLSSIPDSMYEAASMEGATGWESFWKITFPMTTPIIMVNFVYTIVDSFNSMLSPTLQYINETGFTGGNYGYGSAMSMIYFLIIGIFIAIVFLLTRKRIFYYV